jgi:hypothetical protein
MVKKIALMPALLLIVAALSAQRYVSPVKSVLLRGPYLQSVTPSSAVIRWRTESPHILTVKKGESVVLRAPFSGQWSNKETGESIEVKPSKTTVFTIKDGSGCLEERFEVQVTK